MGNRGSWGDRGRGRYISLLTQGSQLKSNVSGQGLYGQQIALGK